MILYNIVSEFYETRLPLELVSFDLTCNAFLSYTVVRFERRLMKID